MKILFCNKLLVLLQGQTFPIQTPHNAIMAALTVSRYRKFSSENFPSNIGCQLTL